MGPSISVLAVEVGFAGALVCLGSLMWFALAVRGRRAGRHPACRGCGFDLTGLLPGAATCPECGRSLAEPKSIVVGRRVRSAWSIGLAAMLLLASSGVLGTLWAARVSRAGWNSYKPAWMLADEADSADAARASAALLELGNRLRAGTLSGSRTRRLIRHALGVQADPALAWRAEWGDLIDLSISKQLVSAEQRKGYYEHMAAPAVSMRRRLRADGAGEVRLSLGRVRAGGGTYYSLTIKSLDLTARPAAGGEPIGVFHSQIPATFITSGSGSGAMTVRARISAPPGAYRMTIDVAFDVGPGGSGTEAILSRTLSETIDCEVVGPGVPLVALRDDPSMEPLIRAALRKFTIKRSRAGAAADIEYSIAALPMPVAFHVKAVRAEPDGTRREWGLPDLVCREGSTNSLQFGGVALGDLPAGPVDLVLTADAAIAESSTSIEEIWNGTITLRDIPVVAGTPAAPTTGEEEH